jgi:hypothetical protein
LGDPPVSANQGKRPTTDLTSRWADAKEEVHRIEVSKFPLQQLIASADLVIVLGRLQSIMSSLEIYGKEENRQFGDAS